MYGTKMLALAGVLVCLSACAALLPAVLVGVGAGVAECLANPDCSNPGAVGTDPVE